MQRPIVLLGICQAFLIVMAIYRENRFIQQLYRTQRTEQQLTDLTTERKRLYHQLQNMKQSAIIKNDALYRLKFQPIRLSMIKPLYDTNETS